MCSQAYIKGCHCANPLLEASGNLVYKLYIVARIQTFYLAYSFPCIFLLEIHCHADPHWAKATILKNRGLKRWLMASKVKEGDGKPPGQKIPDSGLRPQGTRRRRTGLGMDKRGGVWHGSRPKGV
ncbi:uncharacterized protein CIMG_12950 [Coccidioides immitis RS]|uniref:Uncharacterized protein n=1 Tax=Coccidioides immitis (strain RS) TaxID=246410 RepID=A0A0D8JTG1_COCIM|nr:uncharacterized protein CIMG_12950 [Coccidioides immitis RS]KJF60419.1 hypothetical protein CIMG_12950 [Coccidioides immitis RS]